MPRLTSICTFTEMNILGKSSCTLTPLGIK